MGRLFLKIQALHRAGIAPPVFWSRQPLGNADGRKTGLVLSNGFRQHGCVKFAFGVLCGLGWLGGLGMSPLHAEEKTNDTSRISAVRNQVQASGGGSNRVVDVGDPVRAGEAVKTGEQGLVELKGQGDTAVRIGEKSSASFDATNRQVKVDQGTVLIHAPEKEGPVQITAGGVTVTVEEEGSGEKKAKK